MMEIDSLLGIVPTKEEELLLLNFKGDITELARPEKYILRLMKIKNYKERIKNLKIFNKFSQDINYIMGVR
jgi:hypothetical protein